MDKQSGHLSDAQVEQYGNTVTPEQPEADDRDHQIETHLADCTACRERLLAAQRKLFTQLADPNMNTGQKARRLNSGAPTNRDRPAPGPDCPDEDDLRSLAAGLTPTEVAIKLTRHAAQCDHCGPLLRTYTEDFSEDLSDEDRALLAKLQSSSAGGQKKLVVAMLVASGKSSTRPSKKAFPWRWVLAPATLAACAAIGFAIWYQQRETPEKVEKLLAQAYTENRTMEMRLPGAAYAPVSPQQRGNSRTSSPSLFTAKAIILNHLRKTSTDANWLHALGREEMLEWRTEDAMVDLQRALDEAPDSIPIMVDLAMAHSERASLTQNIDDDSQAIELLGKALVAQPDNPVILFNRALVYQRMSPPLYESSLEDWDHYLRIEPQGPWSEEARHHKSEIDELKKKSSDHQ